MKRNLAIAVLASIGLAGCVAVPMYDTPVVYSAPAVVYGPPAVVVRPYVYSGSEHNKSGLGINARLQLVEITDLPGRSSGRCESQSVHQR